MGWEVQEWGDICIPMADSCWCMADTNIILKNNYSSIKNKLRKKKKESRTKPSQNLTSHTSRLCKDFTSRMPKSIHWLPWQPQLLIFCSASRRQWFPFNKIDCNHHYCIISHDVMDTCQYYYAWAVEGSGRPQCLQNVQGRWGHRSLGRVFKLRSEWGGRQQGMLCVQRKDESPGRRARWDPGWDRTGRQKSVLWEPELGRSAC